MAVLYCQKVLYNNLLIQVFGVGQAKLHTFVRFVIVRCSSVIIPIVGNHFQPTQDISWITMGLVPMLSVPLKNIELGHSSSAVIPCFGPEWPGIVFWECYQATCDSQTTLLKPK